MIQDMFVKSYLSISTGLLSLGGSSSRGNSSPEMMLQKLKQEIEIRTKMISIRFQ